MGWCLFSTLAATAVCGWLVDQSAPYFPIELSRTATGRYSAWIFSLGLTLSCACLLWETKDPLLTYALLVAGVLLLCWVTDEQSHSLHMLGVYMAFVGAIWAKRASAESALILTFAVCLFLFRLVMKVMVIVVFEFQAPVSWDVKAIFHEALRIMNTGVVRNPSSLVVFQAAGVLQWVVIWMAYQALATQFQ